MKKNLRKRIKSNKTEYMNVILDTFSNNYTRIHAGQRGTTLHLG